MQADPERAEHAKIVEEIIQGWMLLATLGKPVQQPAKTSWFEERYERYADRRFFLDPKLVELLESHLHPQDWLPVNPMPEGLRVFYALLALSETALIGRFVNRVVINTYDDRSCGDCAGDMRIMLSLIQVPVNRLRRKVTEHTRKQRARREVFPAFEYAVV